MIRPHLTRLTATNFRNYARTSLGFDGRPVVFVGPNGAGKTNLLEAISFLSPGRGLRSVKATEASTRDGEGPWAVAAVVEGRGIAVDLGTGLVAGGERRIVRRDGRTVPQTALGLDLGLLWLTPLMDRLWVEGASGRRRFLDRLVLALEPAHAERSTAYDRAREERLRLLSPEGPRADPQWLDALEVRLGAAGATMAAARVRTVAALNGAMDEAATVFPKAELSVKGGTEAWCADGASEAEVAARLGASLKATRARDSEAGVQTEGPHRSDFSAVRRETGVPAAQCSTGEQKALLLSIVLGQARLVALLRGETPILLLDEVAAHLDPGRRHNLHQELLVLGTQVFLTGTEDSLFDGLAGEAQFFDVREACARPRPTRGSVI